jgi:NAD(P)H-hydrate epimerase
LVRVFSDGVNCLAIQTALPEALFTAWDEIQRRIAFENVDAAVCGPGLGTTEEAAAVLYKVLATGSAPLLLDADALNVLAQEPSLRDEAGERPLLLTPHPGEMARLLGCGTGDITADPFAAAEAAAERFRCAVLLKGAPSIVAAPDEPVLVNVTGHSGIATGGTGDTLAGVAGALLAQGAEPQVAGALALFYSGRAAEIAGRGRGLLPRDIAEALPAALAAGWTASPLHTHGIRMDLAAAQ